jgi:hypothetical protein
VVELVQQSEISRNLDLFSGTSHAKRNACGTGKPPQTAVRVRALFLIAGRRRRRRRAYRAADASLKVVNLCQVFLGIKNRKSRPQVKGFESSLVVSCVIEEVIILYKQQPKPLYT